MKPFRPEKVGREVQAIIGDTIQNRLQDPRIAPMTSVTRVEVSGDLEWAKVYVSVFGADNTRQRTMAALQHASGYIQKRLARMLKTRQCPQVIFHLDESIRKGFEIIQTIESSVNETRPPDAEPAGDPASEEADT